MTMKFDDLNSAFQLAKDASPMDGRYCALAKNLEFGLSKANRRQLVLYLDVNVPGRDDVFEVQKYYCLEPEYIYFLSRDLQKLEIDPKDAGVLDELETILPGSFVEIDFRRSGDYYDIQFIRLVYGPASRLDSQSA